MSKMTEIIRDILNGGDEVVGRSCVISQAENGVLMEFYGRPIGKVVYDVWMSIQALRCFIPTKYYIYYVSNTVRIYWGDVPSTTYVDPYLKVKQNLAAKDAAIEKKRKQYRKKKS